MSQHHSGVQKRVLTMGTVLHDCLAHFSSKYVLKEEQRQAVLLLLEEKHVVAVLSTGFGKSLIYQLFAAVKLEQRAKERGTCCIAITKFHQGLSGRNERS